MSEPNDTAQEGFDQLKRNLEVRYPEDSDLSLDEFLNVESLLALAVRVCGPGADPRKADRLLSNYQLIRPETIGADGHLMQMARRHLFSLASSTAWRRLLGLYERAEYERYRFFDIANGGMALREHPLTGIDRMPIYIDRLLGDVKLSHKNVVARPKGRYSYTCKPEATGDTTVTGSIRWVTMPDAVPPQTGKIDDIPRKSRRPPIDITLDELISTADEVGEKTGKTHYAAVLRRVKDQGLLKRARGGSTSVADGLRLDEVVSLVGTRRRRQVRPRQHAHRLPREARPARGIPAQLGIGRDGKRRPASRGGNQRLAPGVARQAHRTARRVLRPR